MLATFSYDDFGQRALLTRGNNVVTGYTYVGNDPVNAIDSLGQASFFVSRGSMFGRKHSFILITKVGSDGKHTIAKRYTYGARNPYHISNGSVNGPTVRITDPNRDVFRTDDLAAKSLVHTLNDPTNVILRGDITYSPINAPDNIVDAFADAAIGAPDYDVLPELSELGK